MPNWCFNILTVDSKGENVVNFLKKHINEKNEFDFNTIISEPNNESEVEDKYNFNKTDTHRKDDFDSIGKSWFNWYEWRYKYWGVKWNSSGKQFFDYTRISEEDNVVVNICFRTPWKPPEPIIKELILMYPYPEWEINCNYYDVEYGCSGWIGLDIFEKKIVHESVKYKDYTKKVLHR